MYKKIIWAAGILGWTLAVSPSGRAQSAGNGVRIYTDPAGLYFQVDGQYYQKTVDLLWPANSKHIVTSYDQTISGTQFILQDVTTNLSTSSITGLPITADAALKWIKLTFAASYLLTVDLVNCPDPTQPCIGSGTVQLNGKMLDRRTQMYIPANSSVNAKAFPKSGYVFTGWGTVYGLGRAATEFDITFKMAGPTQLSPFFQPANAVKTEVNVVTDPPQLQVLLDRTPYTAPVNLEWGWNTTHAVGATPVQVAQGVTYIFESWSDRGAINHDFQVPSQSGAINLMARFVPGTVVAFQTSPPGLPLSIDGRQNWPNYNFVWLPGSTHPVSAPATQTDAQGHKYRFVSWSNGKTASFEYTAGPAPGNERVTAVYQALGQATINSVPAGLTLEVDGANCTTPCAVEKDAGATVTISAAAARNISDESRLIFQGWGDSAGATRSIALSADATTYTATYLTQNRLSVSATPSDGATFVMSPSSPDGFYDAGALVTIAAKPALGFRLTAWSGDISGNVTSTAVMLDSPKTAALLLDRVPAIAPLGVRSAAAGASPDAVAPGSLISIFGANLAPDTAASPATPLAQTLASVTVRADGTFLPLVFVSPGQINAQLPANLAEGNHKIIVRWEGKPETAAQVLVARNAPGLLSAGQEDQPLGLFTGPDGSPITADRPAKPGDIVSVLGTGLGPYVAPPPDGFLLDEASGYTLVDPVTVVLGQDMGLNSLYAGRSGVAVGVDAVRFQLPVSLPPSPLLTVRIRINGKESNTVSLPISQ